MSAPRTVLPPLVTALLSRSVPQAEREAYIGDVAELYAERVRAGAGPTAWLAREVLAGVLTAIRSTTRFGVVRGVIGFAVACILFALVNAPTVLGLIHSSVPASPWVTKIGVNALVLVLASGVSCVGQKRGRLGALAVFALLVLAWPVLSALAGEGPGAALDVLRWWRPPVWWIALVVASGAVGALLVDRLAVVGSRRLPASTALPLVLLFGAPLLAVDAGPVAAQSGGAEDVVVPSGAWGLHATLERAAGVGPMPGVLLLHRAAGDRHEYGRLAGLLAARGITSLRVDLPGHGASTARGRFEPGVRDRDPLIWDAERHVAAAVAYLRGAGGVDAARIGVVGASYSGEEALEAVRTGSHPAEAYVLLSPGSLSEASLAGLAAAPFRWLYIASEEERPMREITPRVPADGSRGEVLLVPGRAHATAILEASPETEAVVADWLARVLIGGGGQR